MIAYIGTKKNLDKELLLNKSLFTIIDSKVKCRGCEFNGYVVGFEAYLMKDFNDIILEVFKRIRTK